MNAGNPPHVRKIATAARFTHAKCCRIVSDHFAAERLRVQPHLCVGRDYVAEATYRQQGQHGCEFLRHIITAGQQLRKVRVQTRPRRYRSSSDLRGIESPPLGTLMRPADGWPQRGRLRAPRNLATAAASSICPTKSFFGAFTFPKPRIASESILVKRSYEESPTVRFATCCRVHDTSARANSYINQALAFGAILA